MSSLRTPNSATQITPHCSPIPQFRMPHFHMSDKSNHSRSARHRSAAERVRSRRGGRHRRAAHLQLWRRHAAERDAARSRLHLHARRRRTSHRTAIFVGGSDVTAGEAVLAEVKKHLIPQYGLSVSLMLDSNGSNTTAAAAVRAAGRHLDLEHGAVARARRHRAGRSAGRTAAGEGGRTRPRRFAAEGSRGSGERRRASAHSRREDRSRERIGE